MGKVFDEIDERIRDFIDAQLVFFVATAHPSSTTPSTTGPPRSGWTSGRSFRT